MNDELIENCDYDEPLDLDEKDKYEHLSPTERLDIAGSILAVAAIRFKQRNTNDNNTICSPEKTI